MQDLIINYAVSQSLLTQGVQEYWIVDWQLQQIQVYQRQEATLVLLATLLSNDELNSPLLPGFTCPVARIFS